MVTAFLHSFQSEWLKRKRSAASWLVIAGAFFVPAMSLIFRLTHMPLTGKENSSGYIWELLYNRHWAIMATLLLPVGVILATSLVTQLEFKNNAWKLVHTMPQSLTTIYFSKLGVILVMLFQFFLLFNIGIYLTGIIPALFSGGVSFPAAHFPFLFVFKLNCKYFIDCLPVLALQYLIGLQFKNLLIPISTGLGIYIASMIALAWKYGYISPYIYSALFNKASRAPGESLMYIHLWAISYFILFIVAGYILYLKKKEKG